MISDLLDKIEEFWDKLFIQVFVPITLILLCGITVYYLLYEALKDDNAINVVYKNFNENLYYDTETNIVYKRDNYKENVVFIPYTDDNGIFYFYNEETSSLESGE